jgi:hypothetical protein
MVTYLSDNDLVEVYNGSLFVPVSGILQVVRATDSTDRSTTSTSFVDASISVTITPTRSDSTVLILWIANAAVFGGTGRRAAFQITDSSNNAVSGAEDMNLGTSTGTNAEGPIVLLANVTPGATSAVTHKGRFKIDIAGGSTVQLNNASNTGQMLAIEVAA